MVLVSISFSDDVVTSAGYLKKLVKFSYIFLIFTYFSREQVELTLKATLVLLGVSAAYGILQYYWLLEVELLNRIRGFMSHWMTFSGQLMFGCVTVAGYLLENLLPQRKRKTAARAQKSGESKVNEMNRSFRFLRARFQDSSSANLNISDWRVAGWLALLIFFLFTLALTLTRSAWLGTLTGLFLLLAFCRFRWLAGAVLFFPFLLFLAPENFHQRLLSALDPSDPTTRVRLELLQTGTKMIAAHPLAGVGPRMVARVFDQYRVNHDFPGWAYQHLHNDFIQIGAEMGLIALLLWCTLWGRLFWDFFHFAFSCPSSFADSRYRYVSLTAASALAAFLFSGLFEYNFGDAEILILLMFLITAPYVVNRDQGKAS